MNISFDWVGTYLEHKPFFDVMALAMQKEGHRVGIITNERDLVEVPGGRFHDRKQEIINSLGFKPDFIQLWGQFESIANGNLWKAQRMDVEDVYLHFDDDAHEIKRYTGRWVVKTLNSGEIKKF